MMADIMIHAQIDYLYYCLEQFNLDLKKQSPIDRMVVMATRYNLEEFKYSIKLVKKDYQVKEKVRADYSYDKEFLAELKLQLRKSA